jgi:hypothetical protein
MAHAVLGFDANWVFQNQKLRFHEISEGIGDLEAHAEGITS